MSGPRVVVHNSIRLTMGLIPGLQKSAVSLLNNRYTWCVAHIQFSFPYFVRISFRAKMNFPVREEFRGKGFCETSTELYGNHWLGFHARQYRKKKKTILDFVATLWWSLWNLA